MVDFSGIFYRIFVDTSPQIASKHILIFYSRHTFSTLASHPSYDESIICSGFTPSSIKILVCPSLLTTLYTFTPYFSKYLFVIFISKFIKPQTHILYKKQKKFGNSYFWLNYYSFNRCLQILNLILIFCL